MQIEKMIKYCIYYYWNYYIKDKCYEKFHYLCTSLYTGILQTNNGKTITVRKRRHPKPNSGINAFILYENCGQNLFFAMSSELGCFIIISSSISIKLLSVWIWNSANSYHICHNYMAFFIFTLLPINFQLSA